MLVTLAVIIFGALTTLFFLKKSRVLPPPRIRDSDLVRVILNLEPSALDELLKLYAREFGPGATRYARRTIEKWRSGEVRPNRQTFGRLLVHLPGVMSFGLKCEVLRKLREEYCAKEHYLLTVGADDWRDALIPLVYGIVEKSYTAELPPQVARRLQWLSADDMQVARAILAESQAQESRNTASMIEQDFENIERLMAEAGPGRTITHTIKLPLGTIVLKIRGR